ncbi:transposable element Tcb1 transposase [Trichonephila clavipes]|uniref:Transposable element Tcb1 transposase n=1 Tax=Trichonephila clavipes TaxID=2585209 RepID=A0A8X6REM1_TRICX|nr:transposable element Tcb1 transposase [Trichonephila clavipes]
MNCLTDYQALPWPARSPDSSPIEHVWNMLERRLHLPGNVEALARQLGQIRQEIPQETIRVIYLSMSHRVAAWIQARVIAGQVSQSVHLIQHIILARGAIVPDLVFMYGNAWLHQTAEIQKLLESEDTNRLTSVLP